MVQFATATADDIFDATFAEAKAYGASEAVTVEQSEAPAKIARPLPDVAYQHDPCGWAIDVLGIPRETIYWSENPEYAAEYDANGVLVRAAHEWDGDANPLVQVAEYFAQRFDVAVPSGTGTGKTYWAAVMVLWFLVCFEESIVVTTAPKLDQLTDLLWKEIGRHWRGFSESYPTAAKTHLRVRLLPGTDEQETWAAIGWPCGVEANEESAKKAQGFHAKHMLIVMEETPGIPLPTMNALVGTSVGSHNLILALGNPDSMQDTLAEFARLTGVKTVRISSFDHPNVVCDRDVVPGATTRKGIARLRDKWGDETPMFKSRARGMTPAEAVDALIKREWVEEAVARWKRIQNGTASPEEMQMLRGLGALGVDVAQSEKGDLGAIAKGKGACLVQVRAFPCPDAGELGEDVYRLMESDEIIPAHVGVDPIGPGGITVNTLDKKTDPQKARVQRLNGAYRPFEHTQRAPDGELYDWAPDAGEYLNLRAQMGWQLREDFRKGQIAMAPDEALINELITVKWSKDGGKVRLEDKKELKKRLGGKSPDRFDAAMYWNWVRRRRVDRPKPKKPDPHTSPRDLNPLPFEDEEFDRNRESGVVGMFGSQW